MAREDPQLKLRLTEELKARVVEAARANGRSVNSEIVARLEGALDRDEDGAFKVWFPPDLLERVLKKANEAEVDPNLLIIGAVEREFPAPRPPDFDAFLDDLRKALELSPEEVNEAVKRYLDVAASGNAVDRRKRYPWDSK